MGKRQQEDIIKLDEELKDPDRKQRIRKLNRNLAKALQKAKKIKEDNETRNAYKLQETIN